MVLTPHGRRDRRPASINSRALGSVVAGKYRVRRLLGSGGMGIVYKAENLAIGRTVALKVLHPHLADDGVTLLRFQREARAAASVGSQHVVQVVDLGVESGGAPYLVMEYIRGRSLAHHLRVEAPFEASRAVRIAGQILSGLAAVHERGIIHRDLKPDNILLTKHRGRTDFVKIFDFGVAAFVEGAWESAGATDLTPSGRAMGTPIYAAPEQLSGDDDIDHRSDLHAVGVLLYQMLTGHRPYEAKNFADLCQQVVQEPPRPLSEHLDAEHGQAPPPGLQAVLNRTLAKRPDDRFADAGAMLEALVPFGADPLGGAEPEPTDTFTIDLRDLRARELREGVRELPADAGGLEINAEVYGHCARFLARELDPDAWQELVREEPALAAPPPGGRAWRPEGQLFALLDQADLRFCDGDHGLSARLGRFLAEQLRDLGGASTPELFFSGLPEVWSHVFRDGRMSVVRLGRGYVQVEVSGHPAPRVARSVTWLGFVERNVELCGGRSVDARLVSCEALDDACDRFEATWSSG